MEEAIDVIKNLITITSIIISSLCYCYYISSNLPKGFFRFITLLPIFIIFTILPLHISSIFVTAVATFFITWLANFKLLLFAFDHGLLSWQKTIKLSTFITIAALPIKINQNKKYPEREKRFSLNLAAEILVFTVLVEFILFQKLENLNSNLLLVLYCCLLFLLIDILIALSGYIVKSMVGLELEPPSNEPYLSTSLQDFWGRRWNLTVTNTLRHTVYNPVKSTLEKTFLRHEWATLIGVLTAFIVSGLMHELMFYHLTRGSTPTWEVTMFFVIHGVCVVVEFGVKRGVEGKLRLHWLVSRGLTLGFVVVTSFWLFFPTLIRNGVDVKVLQEFKVCVEYFKCKNLDLFFFLANNL